MVTMLTGVGRVVAPANGSYYSGETVMVAPPPLRTEYVDQPPVVGQIWIGGFWNWSGHRHKWVPGHREAPRAGYRWEPHRWEREGEHWRLNGGRWVEERHHQSEHERHEWR